MAREYSTPEEKYEANVVRRLDNQCWNWKGTRNFGGYGVISISKGITITAHRFAWIKYHNRKIPKGFCIMHSCDNPPCTKPEHLILGTSSAK